MEASSFAESVRGFHFNPKPLTASVSGHKAIMGKSDDVLNVLVYPSDPIAAGDLRPHIQLIPQLHRIQPMPWPNHARHGKIREHDQRS